MISVCISLIIAAITMGIIKIFCTFDKHRTEVNSLRSEIASLKLKIKNIQNPAEHANARLDMMFDHWLNLGNKGEQK